MYRVRLVRGYHYRGLPMDGPRACREDEFDEAIALINSVFRAESDQDIRADYPLVFNQACLEYMRIVRVDGRIVAHVPVAPRGVRVGDDGFTVAIISPTLSHPDYRHRGYATVCLRDCVRIMEEREWPISVLWTQVQTFPFYQNSGWEAMSPQGYGYELVSGDAERFEDGIVREFKGPMGGNPGVGSVSVLYQEVGVLQTDKDPRTGHIGPIKCLLDAGDACGQGQSIFEQLQGAQQGPSTLFSAWEALHDHE